MANRIIINGSQNRTGARPGQGNMLNGIGSGQSAQVLQNAVLEKDMQQTGELPLDENVWGNDRALVSKLDNEVLTERRLFVRVRHVQKLTCDTIYEDINKEPVKLASPLSFMSVDISAAGIGIVCENEIEPGKILGIRIILDRIPYDIKCRVVYCIPLDGKFRAGLKIAEKDKRFMRHLKIYVARITLTNEYASDSGGSQLFGRVGRG
mgnify:CR=1 FL=1